MLSRSHSWCYIFRVGIYSKFKFKVAVCSLTWVTQDSLVSLIANQFIDTIPLLLLSDVQYWIVNFRLNAISKFGGIYILIWVMFLWPDLWSYSISDSWFMAVRNVTRFTKRGSYNLSRFPSHSSLFVYLKLQTGILLCYKVTKFHACILQVKLYIVKYMQTRQRRL